MRILLIHARSFSYNTTRKALKNIIEEKNIPHRLSLENVLVVFTSIEKEDNDETIEKAVDEILDVADRIKPENILVYPYAHLSSNLADPSTALKLLIKLVEKLRNRTSIPVNRAPFGYYKEFKLDCYGHPLAELSKTIKPAKRPEEKTLRKEYYIYTSSKELTLLNEYPYMDKRDLRILVDWIVYKRKVKRRNNRVEELCKKFGYTWDENSPPGHIYLLPKAKTIYDILREYLLKLAWSINDKTLLIERSIIQKPEKENIIKYMVITNREEYVLRNTCYHPQPSINLNMIGDYLPLSILELTSIYMPIEKNNIELCFNQGSYTIPCLHIYARMKEIIDILRRIDQVIREEVKKYEHNVLEVVKTSKNMFEDTINILSNLDIDGEILVEVIHDYPDEKLLFEKSYYTIDAVNRLVEVSSLKIYILRGKEPIYIVHGVVPMSVEKYLYIVLDYATSLEKKGITPFIPTWLSPIQVRFIPIKKEYLEYVQNIARELIKYGFRVDIDDRDLGLGRRIRDAGKEWIPYIVVIGDREVKSNTLNIRVRRTNDQIVMSIDEFREYLDKEINGYPRGKQYLPLLISMYPRSSS